MRFIIDAQLPPALARWMTAAGYHAVHVSDVNLLAASDSEIWDFAAREKYVLVTKDEDFAARIVRSPRIQILWIRQGNCTKKALIAWFEPLFFLAVAALEKGESIVELV